MKAPLAALAGLLLVPSFASAQTLLLNFHSTAGADAGPVSEPYLLTDPAHAIGGLSLEEFIWNNFNTATPSSSLLKSDGSVATGISIVFGGESVPGSGVLDFTSTAAIRTDVNLGSGGGAPGQQSLLGPGSVYGEDTFSTAPGRLGWLGTGSSGGPDGSAIGLRVDGLAAGDYVIYIMARNTNSNAAFVPMDLFVAADATSDTFDFSLVTPGAQLNIGYPSTGYDGQYTYFTEEDNYYAVTISIAEGQSLFIASDGSETETRGFLNMVEIVAVPEASTVSLLVLGLAAAQFSGFAAGAFSPVKDFL